jgi:hypothetical protein
MTEATLKSTVNTFYTPGSKRCSPDFHGFLNNTVLLDFVYDGIILNQTKTNEGWLLHCTQKNATAPRNVMGEFSSHPSLAPTFSPVGDDPDSIILLLFTSQECNGYPNEPFESKQLSNHHQLQR